MERPYFPPELLYPKGSMPPPQADPDAALDLKSLTPELLAYSLPGALAHYATKGKWVYTPHLRFIEDACLQVISIKNSRILISVPPRHGKSTLISHFLPVWFLGHNPDKRVMFISYQAEYAKSWGRKARNTFNALGEEIFGLSLSRDLQAAANWGIEGHDGGMETVGVEGGLTGKGADLLLIDDPTKGRELALNSRLQANQYEWFQSDVYPRLEPNASILIIATRWSQEDLIGCLQAAMHDGGEVWDTISLPAFAEENDALGREVGEALWPERYSKERLQRIQKSMTDYWFNAEFQQRPAPVAGDLIKMDWFRRYKTPPARDAIDMLVLSLDTASKEKEINDYSVITVWALYDNSYYLLDVIRDKLTHPRLLTLTKNLLAKWKPHATLIEDKGSGISLIQHLRVETSAGIIPILPINDKVVRMQSETPAIEAGQVYLPEEGSQPWLADFEDEIRSFPNSARKDQVDSFSQFLRWCRERGGTGLEMY
jgi:predicted phage terminase large subunit-like protein|tara:strand:+ start:21330 stop:22787 length:1458 start_codon:yes stop_codon:yes gene_type:complete